MTRAARIAAALALITAFPVTAFPAPASPAPASPATASPAAAAPAGPGPTALLPAAPDPSGNAAPLISDDTPALSDASARDGEVKALSIQLDRETLKALIGRARFAAAVDDYQARMYRHHQFWTDAAAVAVYIITFFGLVCAGVQFRLFARLRGIDVPDDDAASAGAVELPGGAKINSPFLGVIILFLSLGFFYLYLTNVYPILSVAEIEAKRATAPLAGK